MTPLLTRRPFAWRPSSALQPATPSALSRLGPLCCLLALLLGACAGPQQAQQGGGSAAATATDAAPPLTVAAASSLREVVDAAAEAYSEQHPGHRVRVTSAGSGALLQQLKAGAPADLFLSADAGTMQRAQEAGLLAGPARAVAYNRLVLIAPQTAAGPAEQAPGPWLSAQVKAGARVAIGQPESVPAGRYAKEALERLNLWASVQPQLVYGQNVRQVLDWVARREVGAGFVYATDAALMPERVRVVAALTLSEPVEYQAAALRAAPQPGPANDFLEFLSGPQGQRVFQDHGFLTAPQP